MGILSFLAKFFAVVGSIWMLAVAYKIIGDTWDVLFSAKYKKWLKEWLTRFMNKGKKTSKKLNEIIVKKDKRKSMIFPIRRKIESNDKIKSPRSKRKK